MMLLAAFRTLHDEFSAVSDPIVQQALDAAALETDAEVFGTLTDEAHRFLAAHKLSVNPSGRKVRFTNSKGGDLDGSGTTVYLVERRRLENLCGAAWMAKADADLGC
jgi:hypothetical protein